MRQNLWRGMAIAALTFSLAIPIYTQSKTSPANPDHPLWELNLGPAGLAQQSSLYESPLAFGFVDSDTLVAAWFVSHPRTSPTAVESATLKAAYIDAKTGKERSRSQWDTSSRPLKVYITPTGNLLVRTGKTLHLFSPELKLIHEKEFSTPKAFGLAVSPNGARALVCPAQQDSSLGQLLNTDTFQVLDTVPLIVRCGNYFVGDTSILARSETNSQAHVRTLDQPWHPLPETSPLNRMEPGRNVGFVFLNENLIAENARFCTQSFSILTIGGETLSTKKLPPRHCWGNIVTSRGGEYFGVLDERLRGIRNDALDMYPFPSPDQFVMYRLADLKEVFRLKVEGVSPWFPKRLVQTYAISPNGDRVAIMSNGVVRVYAVH